METFTHRYAETEVPMDDIVAIDIHAPPRHRGKKRNFQKNDGMLCLKRSSLVYIILFSLSFLFIYKQFFEASDRLTSPKGAGGRHKSPGAAMFAFPAVITVESREYYVRQV